MRMAAAISELAKFGWPCVKQEACSEHCAGGMLFDVHWETCPIGHLRTSQHIRILRGFQAVKAACGTIDPRIPAWIVRDLADLAAMEVHDGTVSR
jgi:hypothetical protein